MKKILITSIVFIMFCLSTMEAQNRLKPNTNPHAPKHQMETRNDSIFISSDFTIDKFEMWNENFEMEEYNNEGSMSIDVSAAPEGRYLIATSIKSHMIISEFFKVTEPKKEVVNQEESKTVVEPVEKKYTYIKIPYNLTTSKKRMDTRDSDTIYVKETRAEFLERTATPLKKD